MDREELDKQLEQNGRKIQLNKDDKSSGRKKLFALAAALLIIGGAGGYFMGNFSIVPKGSTAASSSQMFQQTPDKNKELAGGQEYCDCSGCQRSWPGSCRDYDKSV